mmetsp:Transcript_24666/g.32193  ORF Transcript_24666/g.32193 Transcript_24666/m.32193 type:complete len:257 (+) Transcript_24666:2-772(+)
MFLSSKVMEEAKVGGSTNEEETNQLENLKIIDCLLQTDGFPVVVIEGCKVPSQEVMRQAFVFNKDMATWLRLDDAMHRTSELYRHLPLQGPLPIPGPSLQQLQARCRPRGYRAARALLGENSSLSEQATLSHIEEQISSSLIMNSLMEFHQWLGIYTKYLADHNDEKRLRLLCEKLLSSAKSHAVSMQVSEDDDDSDDEELNNSLISWWAAFDKDSMTKSINSSKLLQDIVFPAMASNTDFQRVILEYRESLNLLC